MNERKEIMPEKSKDKKIDCFVIMPITVPEEMIEDGNYGAL